MRGFLACIALLLASSAACAGSEDERVKKLFQSDNYTVSWATPPTYEIGAELEIGDGHGHGHNLGWMRFQPSNVGVDVLSIALTLGRTPYASKWPPDRAPVAITRARMQSDTYAALLRDLAVVQSAKLAPVIQDFDSFSTGDFWAFARLTTKNNTLIDHNWAGYPGNRREIEYAKPLVAVTLAHDAVKGLDFMEYTLSEGERAWASAKFARDLNKFKDLKQHWWVRERYIITIGVIGDAAAFPMLREILHGDPTDRDVYHAINAVTRLTKTDVRPKPVEEMDLKETQQKVLELIGNGR